MKTSILLLLVSLSSNAARLIVYSPCEDKIETEISFQILFTEKVSKITTSLFNDYDIQHLSATNGLYSIFNTPYGSDALFITDSQNMRSYGWCYAVDGIQPNVTMDRYDFDPNLHNEISWVYGMAEMKDGQWISYCTPASQVENSEICSK